MRHDGWLSALSLRGSLLRLDLVRLLVEEGEVLIAHALVTASTDHLRLSVLHRVLVGGGVGRLEALLLSISDLSDGLVD